MHLQESILLLLLGLQQGRSSTCVCLVGLLLGMTNMLSLCCMVYVVTCFSCVSGATSDLKVKPMKYLYNDMASMSLIDIFCEYSASPIPILSLDTHFEGISLCSYRVEPLTQPPISALHALCLCLWPAAGAVSLALTVSNKRRYCDHSSLSVSDFTLCDTSEMHLDASRSLTQPYLTAFCI